LSTAGLKRSDRSIAAFQWLDLFALAAALPLFLLASLPMLAYAGVALAWIAQRAIQVVVQRRASASDDPRAIVGLAAGSMMLRSWIVAGTVFAVGVAGEDEDGLAAAILAISLFTIYFAAQMMFRPLEDGRALP
jgi:hypothetical protein